MAAVVPKFHPPAASTGECVTAQHWHRTFQTPQMARTLSLKALFKVLFWETHVDC